MKQNFRWRVSLNLTGASLSRGWWNTRVHEELNSFTLQIFRFAHLECSLIHHIFKEFESWGSCDENSTNIALEYQGFSLPVMKYIEIHPRGVLNHVLRKESREPMELEATLVNMIMVWSGDDSQMAYFCSWYVRKTCLFCSRKK